MSPQRDASNAARALQVLKAAAAPEMGERVSVFAILRRGGSVLCTHERGAVGVPGGKKEPLESVDEALAREFAEETGAPLPAVVPAGRVRWGWTSSSGALCSCVVVALSDDRVDVKAGPVTDAHGSVTSTEWIPVAKLKHMNVRPHIRKAFIMLPICMAVGAGAPASYAYVIMRHEKTFLCVRRGGVVGVPGGRWDGSDVFGSPPAVRRAFEASAGGKMPDVWSNSYVEWSVAGEVCRFVMLRVDAAREFPRAFWAPMHQVTDARAVAALQMFAVE